MKKPLVRLLSWLRVNVIGTTIVTLTVLVNYDELYERLQPIGDWVSSALGILSLLLVAFSFFGGIVVLGMLVTMAIDKVVRFVVNRIVTDRIAKLEERLLVFESSAPDDIVTKRRLDVVEERLRIGSCPSLNLPDNMPPGSIKMEVQRFERELGFRSLWSNVRRSLRSSSSGHLVISHSESGGRLLSGGSSHYKNRRLAEGNLGAGEVLVHLIESDWIPKVTRMVSLDIGRIGSSFEDPYRERHPRFMSVDRNPDGSCTFRLELQKEGKDESTGYIFDWWFHRLQEAAERASATGLRQGPQVVIYDNDAEEDLRHQIQYVGRLCVEGRAVPRLCDGNNSLFAFDLSDVEVTTTWTTM